MTGIMAFVRRFRRDRSGATTIEFVLVLPVFLMMLFGTIDVGGFAWRLNMAEKATQMGTRMAVVTNPVAGGLVTEEYLGKTVGTVTLGQGDPIPATALGLIRCTSTACTCVTAPCVTDLTEDTTAFQQIVARMARVDPAIAAANVAVEYRGSGLGYAGDPDGMEVVPLVTVRLVGATYQPLMGLVLGQALTLPDFAYSLTMEDGEGTASN